MTMSRGSILRKTAGAPTAQYVVTMAALGFDVTLADLTGRSCEHPLVHYRQATMAAVRILTGDSFPAIGRLFGRDHSTVMNAVERVTAGEYELSGRQRTMWTWTQTLCQEVTRQWAIDTGATPAGLEFS